MKIFISSDMEGTAGVVDWDHVRATGPLYPYYCELLTNEVNAAIEGAMRAGADEFLVNDSHSKMANLKPSELAGSARYLSGRVKPMYMMEGLDETFDAVFFLSYHGSMTTSSTLSHTYFPTAFARVSGPPSRRTSNPASPRCATTVRACLSPCSTRNKTIPAATVRAVTGTATKTRTLALCMLESHHVCDLGPKRSTTL